MRISLPLSPSLSLALLLAAAVVAPLAPARAETKPTRKEVRAEVPRVTSPVQFFGHPIGADYVLPNYRQLGDYWKKLDGESDRMKLTEIGKTEEGRPEYMAIISAPENMRKLERYRDIARRLALAEDLPEEQARELAREGKAVVWIDGGLHANEVLGAQQLLETVYQLVSKTDPETTRILSDTIILAVHANPDGMDLVSDWYMRNSDPKKRTTAGLPRLYQKYIGHDNNRDFYAVTQAETRNMNRVMYREWYPQIVYNHHQTGPAGTVMFAPPFRDPFNYVYDPLIVSGIDLVGAAMHSRFAAENKPGVTMRSGSNYSTWWNGGLRTTAYFHNMIGLLTETIGNPTPIEIPFVLKQQLPRADLPFPIAPQTWHFRQSIDYSVTANYAVLDVASRYRETFLYNIYRMGRNSIERGSRDSWTVTPKAIDRARATLRTGDGELNPQRSAELDKALHDPAFRDPRAYILPADQPDFLTATKLVNTLIETGMTVHRARKSFQAGGKNYPEGSYVLLTAQAFRPHLLDLFEPQDHPNDFAFPGGPPVAPYDNAGWTLAYQMGVQFDRILEPVQGPFEKLDDPVKPPAGLVVKSSDRPVGYVFSHQVNDAFKGINRLLRDDEKIYWLTDELSANGKTYPRGTFYVPAGRGTEQRLARLAKEVGLTFEAISEKPHGEAIAVKPKRVALWDRYGGSIPSGWTRWLLEQFEFPFEVVYPQALDAGDLRSKYDVVLFPADAIPERDTTAATPANVPEEYRNRLGRVSLAKTVPALRAFLEAGGTVLTIGSSTNLAYHLGLPVMDALVEPAATGRPKSLPKEKFYIPGSLMQSRIDSNSPIAHGMPDRVDVFFDESPAFRLKPDAESKGVRRIGWYDSKTSLRSGWAWGQEYLNDTASVIEAEVGKGRLYLFGPEIANRAQPHGTFKLLFNGIYGGTGERVRLE